MYPKQDLLFISHVYTVQLKHLCENLIVNEFWNILFFSAPLLHSYSRDLIGRVNIVKSQNSLTNLWTLINNPVILQIWQFQYNFNTLFFIRRQNNTVIQHIQLRTSDPVQQNKAKHMFKQKHSDNIKVLSSLQSHV